MKWNVLTKNRIHNGGKKVNFILVRFTEFGNARCVIYHTHVRNTYFLYFSMCKSYDVLIYSLYCLRLTKFKIIILNL